MNIRDLKPLPVDKTPFQLLSYKKIPKISGCYALTTHDNYILYIGLAKDLNKRFRQHLDTPEKTNPTVEGKAIWFYYIPYDSLNLPKLERTWLIQFLNIHGRYPILNKMSSPIS